MQQAILDRLATAPDAAATIQQMPRILQFVRAFLHALQRGVVPPEKLLLAQKLSRALAEYRQPSPVAGAARQLSSQGKIRRPGQCVRYWYTYRTGGVRAWDLGDPPRPAELDVGRYRELLLRAVGTILQPFGISEKHLRQAIAAGVPFQVIPLFVSTQHGVAAGTRCVLNTEHLEGISAW